MAEQLLIVKRHCDLYRRKMVEIEMFPNMVADEKHD